MHYLFPPAFLLLIAPVCCCMSCISGCRRRALARAEARAEVLAEQDTTIVQLREYGNQGESACISEPSVIAVRGVVIATNVPSAQATLISSEEAVIYETAAAVVNRDPL